MDEYLDHLPAVFLGIAAPKLVAVARQIEEEVAEAIKNAPKARKKRSRQEIQELLSLHDAPAVVTTEGEEEHAYRGDAKKAELIQAIEIMKGHPKAEECYVDAAFCEWILRMALNGTKKGWDDAQKELEARCNCLEVKFTDLMDKVVTISELDLSMEDRNRLAAQKAKYLRGQIRANISPYSEMEDSDKAFSALNRCLNRRAGIRESFSNTTLAEKERWLEEAEKMLNEGAK